MCRVYLSLDSAPVHFDCYFQPANSLPARSKIHTQHAHSGEIFPHLGPGMLLPKNKGKKPKPAFSICVISGELNWGAASCAPGEEDEGRRQSVTPSWHNYLHLSKSQSSPEGLGVTGDCISWNLFPRTHSTGATFGGQGSL